ncbi:B-box-type zinc finger, partial [Trinorchestia longiramus]
MSSNVFECEICTSKYDIGARKPISLKCGHTFCRSCLLRITAMSGINCPKCRQRTFLPVDELPAIYALIPTAQKPTPETRNLSTVGRCQIHDCNLDHFCTDCGDILCRKCCRQSHQQHRIEYMNDIINKDEVAEKFVKEIQTKMATKVNCLMNSLSVSSKILKSIDEIKGCKEIIQQHETTL